MNITYLDADSREVIDVIDDPARTICEVGAERFAAPLGATVVKIVPTPYENECGKMTFSLELRRIGFSPQAASARVSAATSL